MDDSMRWRKAMECLPYIALCIDQTQLDLTCMHAWSWGEARQHTHNFGAEIADRPGINAVHLSWSISVCPFIMSRRLVVVGVVWVTSVLALCICMHAASVHALCNASFHWWHRKSKVDVKRVSGVLICWTINFSTVVYSLFQKRNGTFRMWIQIK